MCHKIVISTLMTRNNFKTHNKQVILWLMYVFIDILNQILTRQKKLDVVDSISPTKETKKIHLKKDNNMLIELHAGSS